MVPITFKMTKNKCIKICNFHADRFLSGASGAIANHIITIVDHGG